MFIITILTIDNNTVDIHDIYDDKMLAQCELMKLSVDSSQSADKSVVYEAINIDLNKINIYKKTIGYFGSTKELYKSIVLHEITEPENSTCE